MNVEVALTARYWTTPFWVCTLLSYVCAYLFMLVYMWVVVALNQWDPAQYGVIYRIVADPSLWLLQVRDTPHELPLEHVFPQPYDNLALM